MPNLYGYVYVLQRGPLTKVGMTRDYKTRLRQIETAGGALIDRYMVFHTYAPAACERRLLDLIAPIRTEGEFCQHPEAFDWLTGYMKPRAKLVAEKGA